MPKVLNDRARTRIQACVIPVSLFLNLLVKLGPSSLTMVTRGRLLALRALLRPAYHYHELVTSKANTVFLLPS